MNNSKHFLGVCALALCILIGCASGRNGDSSADSVAADEEVVGLASFDADSAYQYVARQVAFGPRVPNTQAHIACGDWLVAELKRHGAKVVEQKLDLQAFDGTRLNSRNILGQYNPEAGERILLLAHWDCRPWADADPDERNHSKPVDGANDGASGIGVLLEIARQLGKEAPSKGVDILFVDAEDWGEDNNDDSWALGTQAFVSNPPIPNYMPREAILLDMVGGENAKFYREYFSDQSAPGLNSALWKIAADAGLAATFVNRPGGAVTDDHISLIKAGIPAVDIIEFNPEAGGFNPRWHTVNDTLDGISATTLGNVGKVVMTYLRR